MILDPTAVPGQVLFGSDLVARIEVSAALVNELATDMAGGRPVPAPDGDEDLRARATRALREAERAIGETLEHHAHLRLRSAVAR